MSTTTESVTRPPRAHGASILLTLAAFLAAIVLAPVTAASAAEPLPTGTYQLSIDGGEVTLTVAADRSVTVAASDGLVVRLAFDELGQALDEFTVRSGETTYEVEIAIADDGSYSTRLRADDGDDGEPGIEGEVVSTVAGCAPGGLVAQSVGLPNHGTLVSAAASGLALAVEVTDPVTGATTAIEADFSSVEGAEAFCAAIDAAVPSIAEVRAMLAEERAEAAADRAAARAERDAAREAAQRAREAEREAKALSRAAAKAERAAVAEGREQQPLSGSGTNGSDAGGQEATVGEDGAGSEDNTTTGGDATDDDGTSDDGGATDDGGTTGDESGDETTDTATPGNGGGKPTDPGANGKGNGD